MMFIMEMTKDWIKTIEIEVKETDLHLSGLKPLN